MLYFTILMVVVSIGFGVTSYVISKNSLEKTVDMMLPEFSKQAANTVEEKINSEFRVLKSIANNPIIEDEKLSLQKKLDFLKEKVKENDYLRMEIVDTKGKSFYTNGVTANVMNEENIIKALKGEECVTDPLKSKVTSDLAIIYSVPIKSNDKIIGVLSSATKAEKFSEVVSDIKVGRTKSSFIINKDGVSVADNDLSLVKNQVNLVDKMKTDANFKSVSKAIKDMTENKNGKTSYKYKGIEKVIGYSEIKNTGWIVGAVIEKKQVLSHLNELNRGIVIISIVCIVIASILIKFISSKLSSNIQSGVNYIETASKGDLSFRIDKRDLEREDEIGKMVNAIDIMKKSVGNMINEIKNTSEDIENESDSLYNASSEMASSSESVSLSIQEMAKGNQNESEELSFINEILNKFGGNIEKVSKSIEEIEKNTFNIKNTSDDSSKNMNILIQSVESVKDEFNNLVKATKSVEDNIGQINGITNLINSIADQTNLLALNAAIEAARAGEAGRGFSVVADEIRKLAEESKTSSENISLIVNNTINDAKNMGGNTLKVKEDLEKQQCNIDIAMKSFNKITKAVDEIIPKIKNTTKATLEINKDKDNIISKVENISAISQQVSASSEEISASSEEMTAISNQVEETAKKLNDMTKGMKKEVNNFHIE
ncbi:methyl-accepting chemotaxis protein [Clostridium oceanicum]|uniref:Methyl-accepting chemotaxis protein n=2 Tax=Clostridium oceanicum TaxID=1543 RepID=A0ABN1JEJ0_9CLOT